LAEFHAFMTPAKAAVRLGVRGSSDENQSRGD
jgi:hypothetical protein